MRLIIFFLLCIAIGLGNARRAEAAANPCVNPGFEEIGSNGFPVGWAPVRFGEKDPEKPVVIDAVSDCHSGKQSLRMKTENENVAGANSAHFNQLAGRVRFWYKCPSASTGKDNIYLQIIPLLDTGKEGGGQRTVFTIPAAHIGDGQWHQGVFEYNYLTGSAVSVLVGPRINESGGTHGPGELLIDDIVIEELPALLALVAFGADHATCDINQTLKLTAILGNRGGVTMQNLDVSLKLPRALRLSKGERRVSVDRLEPGKRTTIEWEVKPVGNGIHSVTLDAKAPGCPSQTRGTAVACGLEVPVIPQGKAKSGAFLSGKTLVLENENIRLVFLHDGTGYALFHVFSQKGERKRMAVSFPFSQAAVRTNGETQILRFSPDKVEIKPETKGNLVRFRGSEKDAGGTTWSFSADFLLKAGDTFVKATYTLAPDKNAELLRFDGPSLLVGEGSFGADKSFAHFPGLEYLVGDQRSSEGWRDPEHMANRYTPHPLKVTQPVMLVGKDDDTIGLMWEPLQKWFDGKTLPQPVFASPNFLEGQANHRLGLMAPSVPDWVAENTLVAEKPLSVNAKQKVTLSAEIFLERRLTSYTSAGCWLRVKGLPEMPPSPMSLDKALRFCVESELETLWVPEAKGWRAHLPVHYTQLAAPHPNVGIAELLWSYSLWGSDTSLKDKIRAQCGDAMADTMQKSSLSTAHLNYSFYSGNTARVLDAAKQGIQGVLKSQKPDGSWRFEYTEERFKELGENGDVAVGTCASRALELLKFALITGDAEAESAGLKALDFMDTLARPEGAQTWEVPLHVPDVVAAGQAVDAYLAGYRLTGNEKYLKRAVEFGYSGIPFAYTWNPPDRPIMRYGTIPVFGTTWHALPWYGLIVQWCGLVHTAALLELAEYDHSFPWREFARGELICGLQLQEKPGTPMQGTYPDVYSAVTGGIPFAVPYIHPHLHMQCLFSLLDLPRSPETTVIRDSGKRVSITSGARLSSPRFEFNPAGIRALHFELLYPKGETSTTLVTCHGMAAFRNNLLLPTVEDLDSVEEGIQESPYGLLIKLKHDTGQPVLVTLHDLDE